MKKIICLLPLMAFSLFTNCAANVPIGDPKPLEDCSWDLISRVSKQGKAKEWFKVGDTKTVIVNNQPHKVRIIGFDQDVNIKNDKIGITFEFANLISNDKGYSIATQWNDTREFDKANNNYLDSTLRKALNRTGGASQFLWSERNAHRWSHKYENKTVLDMLPSTLTRVIKKASKYVQCKSADGKWEDKQFTDKLFLLSPREMGYEDENQESSDHTQTYQYYLNHTEETDEIRIKKQVKDEYFSSIETIWITSSYGQLSKEMVANYAGFNSLGKFGYYFWSRSPNNKDDSANWITDSYGRIFTIFEAIITVTYPVAPAFCI